MAPTANLAHFLLPAAVYRKLRKTRAVAHHILILLVVNISYCST